MLWKWCLLNWIWARHTIRLNWRFMRWNFCYLGFAKNGLTILWCVWLRINLPEMKGKDVECLWCFTRGFSVIVVIYIIMKLFAKVFWELDQFVPSHIKMLVIGVKDTMFGLALFADDILLFVKANQKSTLWIIRDIREMERGLELNVNTKKSNLSTKFGLVRE